MHALQCLTSTDYELQDPVSATGMGMWFTPFEDGSAFFACLGPINGFFLSGKTLCGRVLSEKKIVVRIYPTELTEKPWELMKGE